MRKKNKKILSIIMSVLILLSFGQSALSEKDIHTTQNIYSGIEKASVNTDMWEKQPDASNTKGNIYTKSDNSKNHNSDLIDENGELKETVIVDNEGEYFNNDNRIIIEYRNGVKEPEELSRYADKQRDITELIKVYKIKSKKYIKKVLDIAKKYSSGIQAAQPDYKVKISNNDRSTDTYEGSNTEISEDEIKDYYADGLQWALKNDGTFINPDTTFIDANIQAVEDIDLNAEGAWETIKAASDVISQNKESVVVAVVDTGIDYTHDEIKNVIWENTAETKNGSDSDKNGYIDDTMGWNFTQEGAGNNPSDGNGHGTAIAGVLAAANDNKGVVGIASDIDIKIMPVKSLDSAGEGYMSALIDGIRYADNNGAAICNCSWGGEADLWQIVNSAIMIQLIEKSDMLFVVAAGNDAADIDQTEYIPASVDSDNLISVGSIEWDGSLSWYSSYGKENVELCAPGSAIYTTATGGGYTCEWGTSFSSPYVAGVAALAKAAADDINCVELKEIICNTDNMKMLSGLESYVKYEGIPDAEKVVKAALVLREERKNTMASESPSPTVSPASDTTPLLDKTPSLEEMIPTETPDVIVTIEPTIVPEKTVEPDITKEPLETSTPLITETPLITPTPTPTVTPIPVVTPDPWVTPTPTVTETPASLSDTNENEINISSAAKIYKSYMKEINVQISGEVSEVKYSRGKKNKSFFRNDNNGYIFVNNKKFTIYASKPGWYTVYVKSTDGSEYVKNVFANVKIVKVSKTKLNLKKGAKYKLIAQLSGKKKYKEKLTAKIYFKSSNKKIVSVNKKTGRIKVRAKGKAIITAYTKNGKSAKCTVRGK